LKQIHSGIYKVSIFILVTWMVCFCTAVSVSAGCTDSEVWTAFPSTDNLIKQGLPVNDQLKNDSGPTVNQDATKTYSRRWQGGSSSWGASVTLTIHPNAKLAADTVQKYGDGLTKSKAGVAVKIGDLGFKTNDLMRPYYMIQKKCLVVTFYTSSPRRTMVGDQDQTVNQIVNSLGALSCCQANPTGPQTQPANDCPILSDIGFAPANPTPTDTVSFTAKATDKNGDKIDYTWKIQDFNGKIVRQLKGAKVSWKNPPAGNYNLQVTVKDADPNCIDWQNKKLVVLPNPTLPNLPPTIRLSLSPSPPLTTGNVLITAVVIDPDGDALRGGWGHTNTGGVPGGRYPKLQTIPGTSGLYQPVKKRNGNTFTWKGRVEAGPQEMTFGAEDVRGGKSRKTISFVVIDPAAPLAITLVKTPKAYSSPLQSLNFKVIDNAPTGQKLTYNWWIDGKREKNWNKSTVTWPNPSPGYHEVKVQVWLKSGATATDKASFTITSTPQPPPAQNTPPSVKIVRLTSKPTVGKPVNFKAIVTDPNKNDTHLFTWRLGGNLIGTKSSTSWQTKTAGSYQVKITVSDGTDRDSATHTFQVTAKPAVVTPPPPPKRRSIIKSAALFHTNAIHGYGNASKFQTGEEIGLRLEINPVSASHRIEINWLDPRRRRSQNRAIDMTGNMPGKIRLVKDFLKTNPSEISGIWAVEILVDGRFERNLTFSLATSGSVFSAPSKRRPGTNPGVPQPRPAPGSGWKNAF